MKMATWNVNSLRVRLEHVIDWLSTHQPDCLVLQETKTTDDDFPIEPLLETGYHVIYTGQKTYNGVAIISKEKPSDVVYALPGVDSDEKRFLAANIGNKHIIDVYVPNGAALDSPKYPYKLDWLAKLRDYLEDAVQAHQHVIIAGDFNIAPSDQDVYAPDRWQGSVLVSDKERQAFSALLKTGLFDMGCVDETTPLDQRYTWWDYRNGAYWKNQGLRIDHILATKALSKTAKTVSVDRRCRQLKRPSDHAPVWLEFQDET